MACQKYYEGLCMGGDCQKCKVRADRTIETGNEWLGAGLITIGLIIGIFMMFCLWLIG